MLIDPIDVKKEIQKGNLRVFVKNGNILLQDIGGGVDGDTVKIGEVKPTTDCVWGEPE